MRRLTTALGRALACATAPALLCLVPCLLPGASATPRAPAEFVALSDVDPTILQEIRYATPHNFTGSPVTGYQEPMCILTAPAATALHRVQAGLRRRGYSLKVYDCYRPQRAVDRFAAWSHDPKAQSMKGEFYPRVAKSRLFADGYIAARSGHSRGSTVDLTVVKLPAAHTRVYRPGERLTPCYAPVAKRFPDDSIDMGTGFDCFDTLAHTMDPRVRGAQRADRMLLRNAMAGAGFSGIPDEWWHFTYGPEPFPGTYFDFPVSRTSLGRR
jgi:D-alanyl-D-alanine dipeptidase